MEKICVFCKLLKEDSEKYVVFENNKFLAFLDKRPLFHGHILLIPKTHYQTLYDAPDSVIKEFFVHVKMLGFAVQEAMGAEGTFIAMNNIVSQSVPHLHMHIVPRKKGDGLIGFFWPRTQYKDSQEMHDTQTRIKKFIKKIKIS